MSTRGRPLSLGAFVGRAAAVLEEHRKKEPDRFAILFTPEGEGEEQAREIDAREISARAPAPGRYVFVERVRLADGSQVESEQYEARVTKAQLDRSDPERGGASVMELRAAFDAAHVAQRGVTDQWRSVAESEARRSHETHEHLMGVLRSRDERENALRAERDEARERAIKAEAAAEGWRPEHVTALLPLLDRALALYQGKAEDRATVKLLDALPVDLRDQVLDALDQRDKRGPPR